MATVLMNSTQVPGAEGPPKPFSDETLVIIEVTVRGAGLGSAAIFGLVTNMINMIVFYRQGVFTSSSLVSLAFMSLSDFSYSVLNLFGAILSIIESYADFSTWRWDVWEFDVSFVTQPMVTIVQITCCITAYVSFERACCVAFPFTAKSIFSPRVALVVNILIIVISLVLHIPCLGESVPRWVPHPNVPNTTQLRYIISDLPTDLVELCHTINGFVIKFSTIAIVIISNIVIIWKVKLSSKFRKGNASASTEQTKNEKSDAKNNPNTESDKDVKLMRMIMAVSIVFVVCFIGQIPYTLLYQVIWTFSVDYHLYSSYLAWDLVTFIQSINSAVNIIIYYTMSTRFREECRKLFNCKSES